MGCGLLKLDLVESVKLEVCQILMHLTDLVLLHRVESVVSFATLIVGKMQTVGRKKITLIDDNVISYETF